MIGVSELLWKLQGEARNFSISHSNVHLVALKRWAELARQRISGNVSDWITVLAQVCTTLWLSEHLQRGGSLYRIVFPIRSLVGFWTTRIDPGKPTNKCFVKPRTLHNGAPRMGPQNGVQWSPHVRNVHPCVGRIWKDPFLSPFNRFHTGSY